MELGAFAENLERLTAFIEGPKWHKMPEADRDLIIEQRNHMTAYLGVLQRRVARFVTGEGAATVTQLRNK